MHGCYVSGGPIIAPLPTPLPPLPAPHTRRRIVDFMADDFQKNEGIDLRKDKQALQVGVWAGRGGGVGLHWARTGGGAAAVDTSGRHEC